MPCYNTYRTTAYAAIWRSVASSSHQWSTEAIHCHGMVSWRETRSMPLSKCYYLQMFFSTFMGSVQFYSNFIPKLSTLTEALICLMKKDILWRWCWGTSCFPVLKDLRCMDTMLAHFHPAIQIGISCDAFNVGFGGVLFHCYTDGTKCPIASVSRMLTDTQCCYN